MNLSQVVELVSGARARVCIQEQQIVKLSRTFQDKSHTGQMLSRETRDPGDTQPGGQCLGHHKYAVCSVDIQRKSICSESWSLSEPLGVQRKLKPREATGIAC